MNNKSLLDRVEKAGLKSKIEQLVEASMRAREADLNAKREKLRRLFHIEDDYYQQEAKEKLKEKICQELQERKNKILATKQERERQTIEFLKQKKLQQYIASCDEIRPYLRQQLLIDSKACQRMQMEDRRKQQQSSKENQSMWMEIAQRSHHTKLQQELEEKHNRQLHAKNVAEFQMKQVNDKRLDERKKYTEMAEITRQNEKELERERLEDEREKKEKLLKRVKLATDLKGQLQAAEKERLVRNAKEAELNKFFADSIKREIENEIANRKSDVETFRNETIQYLAYLEKVKKERQIEEATKDKIIEELRIKAERERVRQMQEDSQKRRNLAEMVYETQRGQIKENEERRQYRKDEEFKEINDQRAQYNHKAELEGEKQRHRQACKQYATVLLQQEELRRVQERRAREEEAARLHAILEEQRRCEEEAKKFVSQNIDVLPAHPHTKIMNGRKQCQPHDHIKA